MIKIDIQDGRLINDPAANYKSFYFNRPDSVRTVRPAGFKYQKGVDYVFDLNGFTLTPRLMTPQEREEARKLLLDEALKRAADCLNIRAKRALPLCREVYQQLVT